MPKNGKRFSAAQAQIEEGRRYTVAEAVTLVKSTSNVKFNESVDASVRLGVDPRHADQMVRGTCTLPHGIGKTVRILVFASGEAARQAEEAGADIVGGDELVERILSENFLDFDKAVATRDMMGKVGKLGRVLGPRGLMPNPKVGTFVAPDAVAATVRELRLGKIEFRVEKAGIVHAPVGRVSMSEEQLNENIAMLLATIVRLKPSTAKGTYLKSIAISSTMGPGVRIDAADAQRVADSV